MILERPALNTGLREHRITLAEFERMIEAGVFEPGVKLELLDGTILEMSAIGLEHAKCVKNLSKRLDRMLGDRVEVDRQNPILLPTDGRPEPDIVLYDLNVGDDRLPEPADVLLVIEVADSSLQDDRTRKLRLYARDGIREYWIRNLTDDQLEVYRDPDGERYATSFTVRDREPVACLAFPDDPIQWW